MAERWRLITPKASVCENVGPWSSTIIEGISKGITPDTIAIYFTDKESILVQRYNDVMVDANYEECKRRAIAIGRTEASAGGLILCPYDASPGVSMYYDISRHPELPSNLGLLFANVLGRIADVASEKYKIPLRYRPLNDMEAWDPNLEIWRKIVLNGAAGLGNVLFMESVPVLYQASEEDMHKILTSPEEKFADKAVKDAAVRATDLVSAGAFRKRDRIPSKEEFEKEWMDMCLDMLKRSFGIEAKHEEPADWEVQKVEELWKKATDEDWILSKSPGVRFARIPQGTALGKSFVKVPGGPLIRAAVLRRADEIEDILFSGTCHIAPMDALEHLENVLKGAKIEDSLIRAKCEEFFKERNVTLGMGTASTVADAVIRACKETYRR